MKLAICRTRNIIAVCFILHNSLVESALQDYVNGISSYFGYRQETADTGKYGSEFTQTIPYEVSTVDEKFISEAAKLTGVALSELDSCQHRVVLKLRMDCHKLNDEQLAKMAVHLLNCQSYVEGRKTFPCTEEMNIKDCTSDMDSDTWTSYHLMSNRARAVCYTVRQSQFRGLAEHTVNRLMEASKDQLNSLGRIANSQESILNLAENTYDSLTKAHEELSEQQKDIQQAQLHGQLMLESNIMRLVDEKKLIHETHNKLIQMTKDVQDKLESSAQMITDQSTETRLNHKELLEDVVNIQRRANELFEKIDTYSEILLKQNEEFKGQYESTLRNLQDVNQTVHALVNLIGGTRQALEERLAWIMTALGGTDEAVERLYLVLWHVGLILIAMVSSAFLSARTSTRLFIVTVPPLNLGLALYGQEYMNFFNLVGAIAGYIALQSIIIWALNFRKTIPQAIAWSKAKLTPPKPKPSPTNSSSSCDISSTRTRYEMDTTNYEEEYENDAHNETDNFNEDSGILTPPISRNGHYSGIRSRSRSQTPLLLNTSLRGSCHARTRAGTPCKLSSLPGRDYCYRHQSGDSVAG